ncbi:PorP/SprF family type IX secretion system membrane protein [Robertkochia sediminum]|uniref:PorP/SprF family type IX secretion system membrane protein n=1 Tax=Robertkochia sediminum TaxID=2785326 RepID=UPI001931A74F|nr:type IX secretion system membrane protein PorP/SprF [Robertkochia sediminum]MBL7472754.1 type IX secretion system membrane protein PorP/SprF [Robertkochia sediminum]
MRRSIFTCLIVLFGLAITAEVQAQQDAQYTQYMYNTMSVNPAYTGSRGLMSITGLYRNQWLGLDGAPETQTLNVHTPLKRSKFGVGMSIINDKIGNGVNQQTWFDGTVSYTVQTSYEGKLSFGLKVGGSLLNIDFTQLNQYDDVEFTAADNIQNKFSPNIGAGVYYHTDNYYVGLSAPNLLATEYFNDSNNENTDVSSYVAKERVSYYLIGGYVWDFDYRWKFKPAFLTKVVSGAPIQMDLSANFMYNDQLTVGLGYRLDAAITAMFGFQLSRTLAVGLAYDREITRLGGTAFNSGSFEFFLRYELIRNYSRVQTPRFF